LIEPKHLGVLLKTARCFT